MSELNFKPNYIKCPDCKNILDMSFIDKTCPNPLCGFNFAGLDAYLEKDDDKLRKMLLSEYKNREGREYKLIVTSIRYNMGNFLAHFIECTWGAHYNTLYNRFILPYFDDLNLLKIVLRSDVIKEGGDTEVSKNGYKMFWDLYCRLKKVSNTSDIRNFLTSEFPNFHMRHYTKWFLGWEEKMKEKKQRFEQRNEQKDKLF